MRALLMLYLVGLSFACQGCNYLWQSARTSIVQPLIYHRIATDYLECRRNNKLADEAWGTFYSKHPNLEYSKDFECGFKDGFADFLWAGGTGAPPPVPPRHYWNFKYESPEGHQAAQNWFAGFRAGAESARESGYRKMVLIPASTVLGPTSPQASQSPSSSQQPAASSTAPGSGKSTEEMLPPPKPVPAADNPTTETPPTSEALPPPVTPGRVPEQTVPTLGQAPVGPIPAAALPYSAGSSPRSPPEGF